MTVLWFGDALERKVNAASRRTLNKAAAIVTRSIKKSFPGSGIPNATKAQREANRSEPGEIPHIQTGTLKKSIGWELVSDFEAHVGHKLGTATTESGKPATYGFFLELGTKKMAPRPHLRPGLARERRAINRLFREII